MSKSGRKRYCPSTQQEISSQECGEHRNSRYRCPKDCSFNLFAPANYTQLLEAESHLDKIAYEALISDPANAPEIIQRLEKAGFDPHAVNSAVLHELHFRRDASGQTFGERWEKSGFGELKNDLRCLFRAKMGMYIALIEVLRVIDADSVECRDLLNPARPSFLVLDRSAAQRACRHDVILGHCYDLPHFSRIFGTAVPLPFMGTMEPEQIVRGIVNHLGGPVESPGLQEWLADNPVRFCEVLQATIAARHEASLAASDLRIGKALYQLNAPYMECRAALDVVPDVAPEQLSTVEKNEGFADVRVWFASKEDAQDSVSLARETLGTILMGQTFWRLEAISEERMNKFRELFEAALGRRVKFDTVRMDDLHKPRKDREFSDDPAVPPALLLDLPKISMASSRIPKMQRIVPGQSIEELMQRSADLSFLDDSIPALDGATPRAAVQDPKLLPKLRRLLKQRINGADRNSLEKGDRYDAAWLASELGQTDLCTPPPPPRAQPNPGSRQSRIEAKPKLLVPAPAVPMHLPADEVIRRIDHAMDTYRSVEEIEQAATEAGCNWLDIIDALPASEFSDAEYSAVASALIEAWFALVPVGHCAPEVSLEQLLDRVGKYQNTALISRSDTTLKKALKARYQFPAGNIAGLTYLEVRGKMKPKPEPGANALFPVVLINAAVDELHLALGGRTEAV